MTEKVRLIPTSVDQNGRPNQWVNPAHIGFIDRFDRTLYLHMATGDDRVLRVDLEDGDDASMGHYIHQLRVGEN